LFQIEDVGTSGSSPDEIDLSDPKYSSYGVVKVIKDDIIQPYYNEPYEGQVVISYKMRIDQSGTWVFNFHLNDSNTRALKLLVHNDIIESKEIYRLFHALCLLTLDFKVKDEKGAVNQ
jgi:patatin-like phospholipase/acyl hydrolase